MNDYTAAINLLDFILGLHEAAEEWDEEGKRIIIDMRNRFDASRVLAEMQHEARHCRDCGCPLPDGVIYICTECIEDRRRLQ